MILTKDNMIHLHLGSWRLPKSVCPERRLCGTKTDCTADVHPLDPISSGSKPREEYSNQHDIVCARCFLSVISSSHPRALFFSANRTLIAFNKKCNAHIHRRSHGCKLWQTAAAKVS